MWRKRNIIIIAIVAVVVIAGVLGGVAIASADDQTTAAATSANVSALMQKVATIYQQNTGVAIDPQALANAFTQAGKELRSQALDNYLNKLVSAGKITSEQAQQFKDWINARPDVPGLKIGPLGRFGGMFRGWCGRGFMGKGNTAPNNSTTTTQ